MRIMTGSFVILHHTGYGPEHWDFMLEEGDSLATWQCPTSPAELSPGRSLTCRKLPDHRRAYLTYEGPVRRGRGDVRRVEEGEYECILADERHRRVRLHGRVLAGLVELRQDKSDVWLLQRVVEATPAKNV